MALPALGWKVQAWVPCAPTLASSHRCHASSLHEEWGASQPPPMVTLLPSSSASPVLGHPVPAAGTALLLRHSPRTASAARSRGAAWLGAVVGKREVDGGRAG